MRKTYDYITATAKVGKDKFYDYFSYYMGWDIGENLRQSESDEDLNSYEDLLKIESYTDEKTNKRIFNHIGYYGEYKVFFGKPTHIVDNIYLGSAFNAASYSTLKELGIKVIINMTKEISKYYPDDFTYIQYDLYDDNKGSIKKYLNKAYKKIIDYQNSGDKILVHCYMGASRSASVVIYYLMRSKNYSFDEAVNLIKDKRANVNPTFRFTKDLAQSIRR